MTTTYAPRTSTAAVAEAKDWVGRSYPQGWCQKWVVAEIFGTGGVGDFDGDKAADAEDGWKAAVARGRVVRASEIKSYDDIPAGVALYWTGGSRDHGHAAVSAGRGMIYSTDLPTMGKIGTIALTEVARRWGMLFLGYVVVTGNGYTLTDKPRGPVDRMDPKNYGPPPAPSGAHVTWLGERLIAHGFGANYKDGPGPEWGIADRLNVRDFQIAQGWDGDDADGFPGRETLRRLAADPRPAPPTPPSRINFTPWKWTLPIGDDEHPDEFRPGTTAERPPYFDRQANGSIKVRAHAGGTTTKGSDFARSEGRELTRDGKELASWNSGRGVHVLQETLTVDAFPDKHPEQVLGQIHDPKDDVVMVRAVRKKGTDTFDIVVDESLGKDKGSKRTVVTRGYRMGAQLTYRIRADKTGIHVEINGREVWHEEILCFRAYFKAGLYLQTSPKKYGEKPSAFGEITIYALTVSHT